MPAPISSSDRPDVEITHSDDVRGEAQYAIVALSAHRADRKSACPSRRTAARPLVRHTPTDPPLAPRARNVRLSEDRGADVGATRRTDVVGSR